MNRPSLRDQETPPDGRHSVCSFQPGPEKPFVITSGALEMYGKATVLECLQVLQDAAKQHDGLEKGQAFEDPERPQPLWFIEDGRGRAITALLPSEY
jgi:hypothetical protein